MNDKCYIYIYWKTEDLSYFTYTVLFIKEINTNLFYNQWIFNCIQSQ
jgi:hypothetical protein